MLTGVYLYLCAIRYSMMATEAARRLGMIEMTESVYQQSAGDTFIHKIMTGKFAPYGKFTTLYVIASHIVLFLLWIFVAFR